MTDRVEKCGLRVDAALASFIEGEVLAPLGQDAAIIGEVVAQKGVRLAGIYGVKRTLDLPHSEPLPRIC